jgi:hypothetical protein
MRCRGCVSHVGCVMIWACHCMYVMCACLVSRWGCFSYEMRWGGQQGGLRYVRDMCGRVSMGMDSSIVVEYVGWNGSSPDKFVVLVMKVWSWKKSCRERSYRSWLDIKKYYMQWVMAGLLRDSFAGVYATEHSSQVMSIACATTCTAILLFCSMIFQAQRHVHVHTWRAAAIDIARLLNDTAVTPIEVTTHSIHSPILCFMHVFICFYLCSAGSTRRGRGRGICQTVFFYRATRFRMFSIDVVSLLWL